jgi:transposase
MRSRRGRLGGAGGIGSKAIARKRGHRDVVWVTVPLAGGGVEILAGLADRQKETVAACLRSRPQTRRDPSEGACTERYEAVVRASEEEGPWAVIGSARVHVARTYRNGAARVRQQELKRLKRAWPTAEYAELTGAMWPFRQRPVAVTPPAWELLEPVCTGAPTLAAAYHLRADLTELVERHDTKAGARGAMRAWGTRGRESGLAECESWLGTIERWTDASTNSCQGRQPSGFVAGFNNRVKGLKRRGYGLFDVGRLLPRLTLDWPGDRLVSHT